MTPAGTRTPRTAARSVERAASSKQAESPDCRRYGLAGAAGFGAAAGFAAAAELSASKAEITLAVMSMLFEA